MSAGTVRLVGYSPDEPWASALGLSMVRTGRDNTGAADVGVDSTRAENLITIWRPDGQRPGGRVIAFLDVNEDDYEVAHPDAMNSAARVADAYAGDESGLRSAIDWLSRPEPPRVGMLTYLGGLGIHSPLPVGQQFVVDGPTLAGRAPSALIGLRTGPHSDQNVCARHHARLSPAPGGLIVEDLGSTNGTFVNGVLILEPGVASAGQEIALAGCFRFRVG